ncbi:hypothetical protein A3H22_01425 [Candidatus Peribacteria bacterium RIFCSPLOWO2_12_FULL_55_15]|nr:MAG: hypothetical protein A3D12_04415 [Candidatus Peribacteria bacterium RIFCSPHIGHO2_02_FULL_55_24]OGJ67522.1 MAG: hypothetical protein A2947_02375 [Candidatus Peribacteria bacterium RIFCSPLOWO2_01_FULL_54_110]OGJ69277.1 MAG: hypothetical protein A3H90_02095 [Candidatus Peribacteria bacterium RIFCSPLOWO2_02_FULL_55_36]OGJ71779.1 MAG: hypothetical protein A3H22_01425 [Candidatus Peribacteria bacterium RIFCSPLOWO2_12_FULL_55_15]
MTDFFVGGAQRRPSISPRQILFARRAQARLAVGQDEVRAKDFFGSNLFRKKVALPCDFRQVSCLFYPFRHRFEPASPLLFNSLGELIYEIYRLLHIYNTSRIHTALKMPPQTYALQYQTKQFLLSSNVF